MTEPYQQLAGALVLCLLCIWVLQGVLPAAASAKPEDPSPIRLIGGLAVGLVGVALLLLRVGKDDL